MSKNFSVLGTQVIPGNTRQYVLTPQSATTLFNGNKYSNMFFNIPGFYAKKANLAFTTVSITRAYFPDSYYVVSEPYNVIEINNFLHVLPVGDYAPCEFGWLIASYLPNGTSTIVNNKYIFTSTVAFSFGLKSTCQQYVGFDYNTTINAISNTDSKNNTIYYAEMPNSYQFNYPYSYYIQSDPVLNFNYNTKTKSKFFWEILINPTEKKTLYTNETGLMYELNPSNNIDGILIQIKDINDNFINFNGDSWTLVIQITEHENFYSAGDTTNNSLVNNDVYTYPDFFSQQVRFENTRKRARDYN